MSAPVVLTDPLTIHRVNDGGVALRQRYKANVVDNPTGAAGFEFSSFDRIRGHCKIIRDTVQSYVRLNWFETESFKSFMTVSCHVRFYMFCCIPYHFLVRGCIRHNRILYRAKATFCS